MVFEHKAAVAVILVLLLTACAGSQAVRDEDSQYYSVPLGSTFTLNTGITIQPNFTSVYFQFGNIEPVGNIDFYKPHCKFELYTISEQARQVRPDTFTVTRIVDQSEDVSVEWPRYAGLGIAGYDGPVHLTFSTTMYLESRIQPDVFRMTCKRWDWPAIGEYLSINEMRQALGDYFTLTLAE